MYTSGIIKMSYALDLIGTLYVLRLLAGVGLSGASITIVIAVRNQKGSSEKPVAVFQACHGSRKSRTVFR